MSFLSPLKVGFGKYLGQFYAQLVADTPAMREFIARGLPTSIAYVPGRMIDSVNEMLEEWRKNDNKKDADNPAGKPGTSAFLPVMLVAISKDFMPAPADFGIATTEAVDVRDPADPHGRAYKVRVSVNDYRAQIVIISPEEQTAHSLAMQFNLWTNSGPRGRRFKHVHRFADMDHEFGAVLESIDMGAMDNKAEQKNLTILVIDLNIRASIPVFLAPGPNEPNDGKASPAGYPVVVEVNAVNELFKTESAASMDEEGNAVSVFK